MTTPVDRALLAQPFPESEIRYREGAFGKQLAYLTTSSVINRLNEAAPAWDFRVVREQWKTIGQHEYLIIIGELTIPGMGTRSGLGIQQVEPKGVDIIKGAISDALKKAATLFGVGLDLYETDSPDAAPAPNGASSRPSLPPRPSAGAGGASPKQQEFIKELAKDLGWASVGPDGGLEVDMDALNGALMDLVGATFAELSRQQASQAIDGLKALLQAGTPPTPTAAAASDDDASVSWTAFWNRARRLGAKNKQEAMALLGTWSADPRELHKRLDEIEAQMPTGR